VSFCNTSCLLLDIRASSLEWMGDRIFASAPAPTCIYFEFLCRRGLFCVMHVCENEITLSPIRLVLEISSIRSFVLFAVC